MGNSNLQERITILDDAIKQRRLALTQIQEACEEYGELSDFGWFLTLGSEPLGMMTAIANAREFRKWSQAANKLEREIQCLIQMRYTLDKQR